MLPDIKRILYATDLSATARQALGYAASLADRYGAELTVLHVLPDSLELLSEEAGVDLAERFGNEAAHWIDQGDSQRAAQAIRERLQAMTGENYTDPNEPERLRRAKAMVARGDAAASILAEANANEADLLVMGTHGQTGLLGVLLGSVAKEVVRGSSVPVLVVPLPNDVDAPEVSAQT